MSIVFVGGSQRAGTTLAQTILCQDPAVNPLIQEAKYLRHLVTAYKYGKQHFGAETRDYFTDIGQYTAFNTRIVRAFLRNTQALFPGTRHLVLREPHLTMLFPELGELLPGAKFVCMVRDPRDAIASMIDVGRRLEGRTQDAMARLFRSGDIAAMSRHFLSFYAPVLKGGGQNLQKRLLCLRYEDLVKDPAPAIGKLRRFTGIALKDFDAGRTPDTGRIDYARLDNYKKAWASAAYTTGITDSRIGHYRDELGAQEIAAIDKECAAFMREFGYA